MSFENKNTEIKIFPHMFTRIAGEPFSTLEKLKLDQTVKEIECIALYNAHIKQRSSEICEELYNIIPLIKDNRIQNALVKAKRDIFNLRDVKSESMELIKDSINESISFKLQLIKDKRELILAAEAKLNTIYSNELMNARIEMQNILKNENLLKGLLISSKTLLERITTYASKDIKLMNKDDFRTEQSAIKYVSRMCAKTSPFSTFTHLAVCGLNGKTSQFFESDFSSNTKVQSHIRLNNAIFLYLKALMFKNIKLSRWFLLRPNPTIKIINNEYIFLTNFDNIEAFQKIEVNPVIDVFLQLAKEKTEGILFNDLISTIIENEYMDATREELESYVLMLIDYGLFEYNLGVSGIDPNWDMKLIEKLVPVKENNPIAGELISVLKDLRHLAMSYGSVNLEERGKILEHAYEKLRSVCIILHKDAGLPEEEWEEIKPIVQEKVKKNADNKDKKNEAKEENKMEQIPKDDKEDLNDADTTESEEEFKNSYKTRFNFRPQQIYYEDTSVECKISASYDDIRKIITNYQNMADAISFFEINNDEVIKMTDFFLKKFGAEGETDILTFYEDYYREFKKPEADALAEQKKIAEEKAKNKDAESPEIEKTPKTAEEIPMIKERMKNVNHWITNYKNCIEEIYNSDAISLYRSNLPQEEIYSRNKIRSSHALFLQYFSETNDEGTQVLKAVINSYPPGFGKFYSRFLHLFEDRLTSEIIENNLSLSDDEVMVENCDYSHFNANIHPPLMPYEVWLPGSQNSLPPEKQIMVTDISVVYDSSAERLNLIHNKSGKKTYFFDLGFQSIMSRSKLFQILSLFSKAQYIYPSHVINVVNNMANEKAGIKHVEDYKGILVRPRICYEDLVILQRKQWIVPYDFIPFKTAKETDAEYFKKVNLWRIENNIPDEVFVYISYFRAFGFKNEKKKTAKKKSVGDDHKPQYINFKNPFLVSLFAKLCDKASDAMRIEEMLPASKDLLKFGNERYVTEFITQWD